MVPPIVATRLVTHWAAVIDFVDDGLLNGSPELVEKTETVPANSGRHAYTRTALVTPRGQSLIESYLVDEMGHAYPGPAGQGLFTDRAGPDSSSIAWDFAKSHPRRR